MGASTRRGSAVHRRRDCHSIRYRVPVLRRVPRGPSLQPVDEGLQDRAVRTLLRQDRPGDQVDEDAKTVEDREDAEPEPDQVHIDLEVRGKPGAHPGDHPAVPDPEELLALAPVVLSHVSDHAHSRSVLSSGNPPIPTLTAVRRVAGSYIRARPSLGTLRGRRAPEAWCSAAWGHLGVLAQWQSSGLLIRWFRVRPPGAPHGLSRRFISAQLPSWSTSWTASPQPVHRRSLHAR